MNTDVLRATAEQLVAPGRGILAADESTGTIKKRFDSIGVQSTEDNRRAYRDMLFTTPGLGEHISGVILFDETIRQSAIDGPPFAELLATSGIVPGIKVDTGAKPLALFPAETVTEGLDGLRERLADYRELGARFAKWRATIFIGDGLPTDFAILANAHAMARYAALCQEADIVPIVEPEILMDGNHSIEECEAATAGRSQPCTRSSPITGSTSLARSSRSTWCSRGRTPRRRRVRWRWPSPRSASCARTCRPMSPAWSSSPVVRPTSLPPST